MSPDRAGGNAKFEAYGWPTPHFAVLPVDPEALAFNALLERLHLLCHQHYGSLDEGELQQYKGIKNPVRSQGKKAVSMKELKRRAQASSSQPVQDVFSGPQSLSGTTPGPVSDSQPTVGLELELKMAVSPMASQPRQPDPLRNHDAILAAFAAASSDDAKFEENDKTPDQFLNLPGLQLAHNKNESSVGVRKSQSQDVDGEQSRSAKRSKTGSQSHESSDVQ